MNLGVRHQRICAPRTSALRPIRLIQRPIRLIRCNADAAESPEARKARVKETFERKRPTMSPLVSLTSKVATPVITAGSALLAALSAFIAFKAAERAPLEGTARTAVAGVAAVGVGGAVTYAGSVARKQRGEGAGIEVWSAIADSKDPTEINAEATQGIRERYGHAPEVLHGLRNAYYNYLLALLPPGSTALCGDEHTKLRAFLDAVGLSDEDAAPVHIDVGRSLNRANVEASDPASRSAGVKAFQKLVYVSDRLFGEMRSGFLTPWTSRFEGLTPENVQVAKRNGARMIFEGRLAQDHGGKIPATTEGLASLRQLQRTVGLSDGACATLISEMLAEDTEKALDDAIKETKARGGAAAAKRATDILDGLLARSRELAQRAEAAGDDALPGLGAAVSVKGTKYASAGTQDLVELWATYMRVKMEAAGTRVDSTLRADLAALQKVLGLSEARVEERRAAIVNDAYAQLLRDEVTSGRMDEAESPAQVLNSLIERTGMPGEQALALHESLYRQKLRDCLADDRIDAEDEKALARTARLLCLSQELIDSSDMAAKGDTMRKALARVLEYTTETFGNEEAEEIQAVKEDLKLSSEQAMTILRDAGRQKLVAKIAAARAKGNKLDTARELKQCVMYSNIVLAPLVTAVKADTSAAMKELADTIAKAKEEAAKEEQAEKAQREAAESGEPVAAAAASSTEASTDVDDGAEYTEMGAAREESHACAEVADDEARAATGAAASTDDAAAREQEAAEAAAKEAQEAKDRAEGKITEPELPKGQKEITLVDEIEKPARLDLYRTYLEFAMSGDVMVLPMGGVIRLKRDEREFDRLAQFADLMGLNQFDVSPLHQEFMEMGFKQQVEQAAPQGVLSSEATEELREMAAKMGLPADRAQKVLRDVTNKPIIGRMQQLQDMGELTLSKVLELVDQDVDISQVIGELSRDNLYTQHIDEQLASGVGTVDVDAMLYTLPEKLNIDGEKARQRALGKAKDKARGTLVQAAADLRSRRSQAAARCLNNLLACTRINAAAPETLQDSSVFRNRSELIDLYGVFCASHQEESVRDEMARALSLSSDEQQSMQQQVDAGDFEPAMAVSSGAKGADGARKAESFF